MGGIGGYVGRWVSGFVSVNRSVGLKVGEIPFITLCCRVNAAFEGEVISRVLFLFLTWSMTFHVFSDISSDISLVSSWLTTYIQCNVRYI